MGAGPDDVRPSSPSPTSTECPCPRFGRPGATESCEEDRLRLRQQAPRRLVTGEDPRQRCPMTRDVPLSAVRPKWRVCPGRDRLDLLGCQGSVYWVRESSSTPCHPSHPKVQRNGVGAPVGVRGPRDFFPGCTDRETRRHSVTGICLTVSGPRRPESHCRSEETDLLQVPGPLGRHGTRPQLHPVTLSRLGRILRGHPRGVRTRTPRW